MSLRFLGCLSVLLCCQAVSAAAGPWPREEGTHFLFGSFERDRDGNSFAGIYGEYGLRPRVTLGYEFGHTNAGESSALIWLQRAMDDGQGPNRLSLGFGLGALQRDHDTIPMAQIAASWGRGFEGIGDGGWLTADLRVKIAGPMASLQPASNPVATAYLTHELTTKADFTVGLRPLPAWMVISQLRLEKRRDADFSAKLAASVVRDVAGPLKLELGLIQPLNDGGGEQALKLGSWLSF